MRHVARMGAKRNGFPVLVQTPDERGQLGRHNWNGSILRNRLRDMDWTNLAQDMDTWYKHGNRPSGSIKCGNILTISGIINLSNGPCSTHFVSCQL
jgi:hypothetical protein